MKYKWLIIFLILILLIIALASFFITEKHSVDSDKINLTKNQSVYKNKTSCEANGGKWEDYEGYAGRVVGCNPATSDAGKVCNDDSQCESACLAPNIINQTKNLVGICYGYQYVPSGIYLTNGEINNLMVD